MVSRFWILIGYHCFWCWLCKKISFTGIKFDAVYNPIIIYQYYCPTKQDCLSSVSIPNYDLYLSSFCFTFSNPYLNYLFLKYFGWNEGNSCEVLIFQYIFYFKYIHVHLFLLLFFFICIQVFG
ncbi:putative pectin lyase/virulence factor [Helianthus annuus]|nr:putative pectin lyase/virulence factor [Helianthus annuus]